MNILENYNELKFEDLDEKDILKLLLYIAGYKNIEEKIDDLLKYYQSYENIFRLKVNLSKKVNKKFIYLLKLLNDASYNYIYDKIKSTKIPLNQSKLVAEFYRRKLGFSNNEEFHILLLNNNYNYLSSYILSKGSLDRAYIYKREVLYPILECNAKYIIICHNHPSGNIIPSVQDERVTKKISKMLEQIEVNLVDHIIVTKDSYYSFAERGKIWKY